MHNHVLDNNTEQMVASISRKVFGYAKISQFFVEAFI